jgi:hypothetical protein
LRGKVHVFWSPKWQRWIARSWPVRKAPFSPAERFAQQVFKQANYDLMWTPAEMFNAAVEQSKNTPYFPRDLLLSAYYGRLLFWYDENGNLWRGTMDWNWDINALLTSITDVPGSIIFRGPDAWYALLPGTEAQVLTFDSTYAAPQWKDSTANVQTVLDQLTPGTGAVIVFDGSDWLALPAGSANQLLHIDSVTGKPAWFTQSISVQDILNQLSPGEGSLVVYHSGVWISLSPGTTGYALISNGPSALPTYQALPTPPASTPPFHPGFASGQLYDSPGTVFGGGTLATVKDTIYLAPFYVGVATTFTKIGFRCTSGGTGNAELGIYNCANGVPTSLAYDLGSHAVTNNADNVLTGQSIVLAAGWYFLAVAFSANSVVVTDLPSSSASWLTGGATIAANSTLFTGAWTYNAGHLPTPFPTLVRSGVAMPRLVLGL